MSESFSQLLLRHCGRAHLTQRELATRAGVGLRSVQDWQAGFGYPSAERLQSLIAALIAANAFTAGRETEEARALWQSVANAASRMRTPFRRGLGERAVGGAHIPTRPRGDDRADRRG